MIRTIAVFTLILLAGCDPGMRLRPPDWQKDGWTRQWGDIEISTDGIGNLVGSHSATLSMIVRNRGDVTVTLQEAYLHADGKTYRANLYGISREPVKIAPRLYEKFQLGWDLEDQIWRVCEKGCVVVLRFDASEIRLELKNP
jgi:hypothetical protein